MKEKLVVILGPTATGKSRAGLLLAQSLGTEIISGDSMLVYKGFDIGTAKPGREELNSVPHHLVDVCEPTETFSAAAFQQQASKIIGEMNEQGKLPLLVGGTGLYIKSLLEGYEFSPVVEQKELRQQLEVLAGSFGSQVLWEKLASLDLEMARAIHPNNLQRLIRALETALSGKQVSQQKQPEFVYDMVLFGLTMERSKLYERINKRVDGMFTAGLVEEVKRLLARGVGKNTAAMSGIGYKEVVEHLEGNISLQECMDKVARNTRRFAKRQFTWYRQMPYVTWYEVGEDTDENVLLKNMQTKLEERFKLG